MYYNFVILLFILNLLMYVLQAYVDVNRDDQRAISILNNCMVIPTPRIVTACMTVILE